MTGVRMTTRAMRTSRTGGARVPGRPPAHISIRTALLALVIACVLPSLGALGLVVFEDHLQREHDVQRETLLRARGLMATIDRDLAKVVSTLEVLGASQRLASPNLSSFTERLRATPPLPMVLGYLLVARDGRPVLDSRGPYGLAAAAIRAAALTQVFESGEPVLSNLFDDPSSGRSSLALTVPVRRGGDVVYALAAELSSDQLARVLRDEALPDGWLAAVVDASGSIVARSPGGDRYTGQKAGSDLQARVATDREGTFDGIDNEGTRTITSHTRSSLSNITLVVGAPRSALATRLSSRIAWLIAGGAATLGLALWFALRLARAVTRSVESLIEPALSLGSGRPIELPGVRLKEAHAVGQAIEQAAGMLADAKYQAHHDALTGLCNRVLFDEVAVHQIASARRGGRRLAVLAIDLDGFKAVNDRHGHAAGDAVLRTAAERIRRTIRASDVVSRRGGDEFTVLLGDVGQVLTRQIGQKLVAALAEPYDDVTTPVSASVGIAIFPESGSTVDELLARADEALYEAKKGGKRRVSGDV